MSGSVRVHELAKETGTSSKQVISELNKIGAFVKSASSIIEAAVAAKVRTALSGAIPEQRPRPTYFATPIIRRPRREWYRGPELSQLTTMILEEVVTHRRTHGTRAPGGNATYYADEVADAQKLVAEWSDTLFEGLTLDSIILWMKLVDPPISARQAVVLHSGGITPADLEPHPADQGRPALGFRLHYGNITVEQIVVEVQKRRAS